jgi:predicted kinase
MIVAFLKGIPGSGKSTYSKQFVLDNPNYVRINKDDLRRMRGKYWIPEQEQIIGEWELALCSIVARLKKNLIVDGTNLNNATVNKIKKAIKEAYTKSLLKEAWGQVKQFNFKGAFEIMKQEVVFEYIYFDTPVEECIRRDSLREEQQVGEAVIRSFHKKYIKERK